MCRCAPKAPHRFCIACAPPQATESPEAPPTCEHRFSFLRSVQEKIAGPGPTAYERTDFFYCSSCLEEREKTLTEYGYRPPAWWNQ